MSERSISYLTNAFDPSDKDAAALVKVHFANGEMSFFVPADAAIFVQAPSEARDEEAGHPFRGNQYVTVPRVFAGKQVLTKDKLTKLETDALGERIFSEWAQTMGLKDIQSLNELHGVNNYPLDLAADHMAIELKTGLVSNTRGAQQWNVKLGKPGPSEQALMDKMSATKLAAWNEKKMQAAMQRKSDALKEVSQETGTRLTGWTVGLIVNPDTQTADIHAFKGFHRRIGWKSPDMQKAYVTTIKYRGTR